MSEQSDLIPISVIDRDFTIRVLEAPTDMGLNLMELLKMNDLPVEGTCGGMALCASCHVYIESEHRLPAKSAAEEEMLDQAFFVKTNSRLACQVRLTESLSGLIIRLAPAS